MELQDSDSDEDEEPSSDSSSDSDTDGDGEVTEATLKLPGDRRRDKPNIEVLEKEDS